MNAITRATSARHWLWKWVLAGFGLLLAYAIALQVFELGGVAAPAAPAEAFATPVGVQGWSEVDAQKYHRWSQGTRILPLSWFLALERPLLSPFSAGRFASRAYLSRFGFVYDNERAPAGDAQPGNPDLPVGFAIERNFVAPYADPPISKPIRMVGLTCAACHTGRIDVAVGDGKYKGLLIEGGSAMINLSLFQKAAAQALGLTYYVGPRFARFAEEVERIEKDLDPGLRDEDAPKRKNQLQRDMKRYIDLGLASASYAKEHKLYTTDAGFARTDALGLIGNRVFGILDDENQVVTDAPVNFPFLWDTPWFDWVQYNASIRTPMARNIGEALGVGALVNLAGKTGSPYDNTVNIEGVVWMEELLGGDNPFQGLQPPKWKDMVSSVFGSGTPQQQGYILNDRLIAEGQTLYRKHCQSCHLPPRDELKADLAKAQSAYFSAADIGSGRKFFALKVVDLRTIGTDPNQALNFYRRVAVSPEPKHDRAHPYQSRRDKQASGEKTWFATISAEQGLFRVTSFIRKKAYDAMGLFQDDKKRMRLDRYRSVPKPLDLGDETAIVSGAGMDWVIAPNLGYKARPLDGIWATPPYLHNGSVPNLYQMLLPAARRDVTFYLGSTRFDPKYVGYETRNFAGAFELNTALPGNHNSGHEFRNLELEELEEQAWDGISSREARWARVLGVSEAELAKMSPQKRWRLTRDVTEEVLKKPHTRPFTGVLGPELEDADRWALVEYLKTL